MDSTHFEIGEKYLEYIWYSCVDSARPPCAFCSESDWVGAKCTRIPKSMPDYSADGRHYKSVFHTQLEIDGKPPTVDYFKPKKNAKYFLEQGKLNTEDEFDHFCKTFACEKELVKKYVEHLHILEMNKRKWVDVRKIQLREKKNKKFEDYDWKTLFEDGALEKLKVIELDKYLNFWKSLKLKKKENSRPHLSQMTLTKMRESCLKVIMSRKTVISILS